MSYEYIFVLLLAFQLKHFICDYPLQTPYMLGKFKPDWDFLKPLCAHAAVHACVTFYISVYALFKTPGTLVWAFGLSVFDFVIHASMDRIKASPKILGRFKIEDKRFWWSLGLDQMVHHLTHYLIIFVIYNLRLG